MSAYRTKLEKNADRDRLRELVEALGASELSLRVDEYGTWRLVGRNGYSYGWGDGESWVLYVGSGSKHKWFKDKKRLSFCQLIQNGDDEGTLRLFELPTPEQSIAIRFVLGIKKRRSYSPEVLEAARNRLTSVRERNRSLATGAFNRDFSAEHGPGAALHAAVHWVRP